MRSIDELRPPLLALTGLDADLSEEERAVQQAVHRFAENEMRPIAQQMDRLTAEQAAAPDSPWYQFHQGFQALGLDFDSLQMLEPEKRARLCAIVFEELAWGDAGLAVGSMVVGFPEIVARATGNPELIERFKNSIGCWIATQPDRGCDVVDIDMTDIHPGSKHRRGNLTSRVTDSEVIIQGQSSAWVSCAPLATAALAYLPADYGDGIINEDGSVNGVAVLVPLDMPGISKGKPLDKIGQRSLPQGEIFFDEVRLPLHYVVADKDQYQTSFFTALTEGNMHMGAYFTGVARAAYEHALAYAHERIQGGTALINHQLTRHRLFEMFRKVETARAMARRAFRYNALAPQPHVLASITAKTTCTQAAFEVASEALQLFGGNGLSKEYPLEKLLRDARASLIEDGENYMLGLKAGSYLSQAYLQSR